MASPSNKSIEDLLARRQTYGRSVTVPGFEDLDHSQQAQIIARLQQEEQGRLDGSRFDPRALDEALSSLLHFRKGASAAVATEPLIDSREPTPSGPSEDEMVARDRELEIKARQHLEAGGCPPCYPPDLAIPLRDVPETYRKIVSYWRFNSSRVNTELAAQLLDWERFRDYQKRVRIIYKWKEYVDRVAKCRQHNGLGEYLHSLRGDDRELDNWIEFQAYHIFTRIEEFEKVIDMQEKATRALQQDATNPDPTISKAAIEILDFNQLVWKYQEQRLEMERYFLQWTEEKRITINPRPYIGDKNDHTGRKGQMTARSVLGKPRISKRKQHAKKHITGRLSPQKVAPTEFRTRSGRLSRPPLRWVPGG